MVHYYFCFFPNGIISEMTCKALGMAVEVFDPSGNNIEDTGMPGELVRFLKQFHGQSDSIRRSSLDHIHLCHSDFGEITQERNSGVLILICIQARIGIISVDRRI